MTRQTKPTRSRVSSEPVGEQRSGGAKKLDRLPAPPSEDELARRRAIVTEITRLREQIPPISPLTAAELVHMGRDDAFWHGDGAE